MTIESAWRELNNCLSISPWETALLALLLGARRRRGWRAILYGCCAAVSSASAASAPRVVSCRGVHRLHPRGRPGGPPLAPGDRARGDALRRREGAHTRFRLTSCFKSDWNSHGKRDHLCVCSPNCFWTDGLKTIYLLFSLFLNYLFVSFFVFD